MNEIPYREWTGESRVFELVHEFQTVWGGYPYSAETHTLKSQIYKTNTVGLNKNHSFYGNTRSEDKRYECRHVLNRNSTYNHINTQYWLSDEIVDHILVKKKMDFSSPNYVQVIRPNLHFYVGQILRLTGVRNPYAHMVDVITVGQYYNWDGGKQHAADGQLICIKDELLAELTQQIEN